MALTEGLRALAQQARDDMWNIAWCAGAGVVATPSEVMETERATFTAFLSKLSGHGDAIKKGAFFLASSAGGVFAGSADPPFTEETPPHPLSPYGAAKLAMEDELVTLARATGMRTVVGRIANLYGRGQNIEKPQGLISQLCKARYTGLPVSIYVSLDTLRDYLFVADCAEMVVGALCGVRRPQPQRADPVVVKILCSGRSTSIASLIEETRRVLRRRPRVLLDISPAPAHVRDLRLRSMVWPELDRLAHTPIPVGIAATAEDVQRQLIASGSTMP
jgi:UDP-glucose 4-epimerase